MSREADVISHALMLLEQTVSFTTNGTADKPRRVRKIDLACEHISDWADRQLPKDGERGGSSSPSEQDDRVEVRNVARRARTDRETMSEAVKTLNHTARVIYDIMLRNVETLDPAKIPQGASGCSSCARTVTENGQRMGGHFAPVYEKSLKWGLCRWCWEIRNATGNLPPVKACDLYHRRGPRVAGQWVSRNVA